jgi:uncharacterized protein (TIGR04222 family)
LEPEEIGLLRGGRWGAAQTALATLVVTGSVVGAGTGQIKQAAPAPPSRHPLARALYSSLYGAMGPREVTNQPHVQVALREMHRRLVRQRYLRPWWMRIAIPLCLVVVPPAIAARLMARGVIAPTTAVFAMVVCIAIGLCYLPRRTASGARELRRLRSRHRPLGTAPGVETTADAIGLQVALYGVPASIGLLPAHAADLGLVHGGRWNRRLDIPDARRMTY